MMPLKLQRIGNPVNGSETIVVVWKSSSTRSSFIIYLDRPTISLMIEWLLSFFVFTFIFVRRHIRLIILKTFVVRESCVYSLVIAASSWNLILTSCSSHNQWWTLNLISSVSAVSGMRTMRQAPWRNGMDKYLFHMGIWPRFVCRGGDKRQMDFSTRLVTVILYLIHEF